MQLREETGGDRSEHPRKYFHQLKKLSKAVKWSMTLKRYCQAKADDKTNLEAEVCFNPLTLYLSLGGNNIFFCLIYKTDQLISKFRPIPVG
jgi:hypothetical protein